MRRISLLLIVLMLSTPISAYADFDIFDHPKQIERKRAPAARKDEAGLLDYPKECFLKGEYEAAFRSCNKLLEYRPAQPLKAEIVYLMGLSCLKLNRFLEARSYFNDVLVLKEAGPDIKRDAQLGVADSYFMEDKFSEAAAAYKDLLVKYPPQDVGATAYYRLYEIAGQEGRSDEARGYMERLKREFPLSFEAQMGAEEQPKGYSVQAGCFNNKKNADRFCEKLVREGFDAHIAESEGVEEPRYRVKIGRFSSKEEAEPVKDRLKDAGYSTRIVPEK